MKNNLICTLGTSLLRLETLVERIEIDGEIYMGISPTGQIFHETFQGRCVADLNHRIVQWKL